MRGIDPLSMLKNRSGLVLQLGLLVLAAAILVAITRWLADSEAAVGLLGVVVGGAISTAASVIVAQKDRRLQLSMAALDRRLAAHQEAYAIWQEIMRTVHHRDKIGNAVVRAQEWWINNCLYLDATSRNAFRACFIAAADHRDLVEGPRSAETAKLVKDSWAIITKPGQTLVTGVALPPLGDKETPPGTPGAEGK